MKRSILFIAMFIATLTIQAQEVDDMVSIGEGYANQSYYSLSDGEVENINNDDWDIAFDADAFGVSIRINGQLGTSLYLYGDGDTSDWASLDTAGMSDWLQYNDGWNHWYEGAFNQGVVDLDSDVELDYGWGIYNTITHKVIGDSLFVIKLFNGDYKKIWIESMIQNVFSFKYADIDGENEVEVSIDKTDYATKNYVYYSIINEETIDREPDFETWDILFTKYWDYVYGQGYYGVTGALINNNVMNSQADGVVIEDAVWSDYPMNDTISIMGWDWKYFNFDLFQYEIVEDRCYFIQDVEGNVWKLVFTDFIGSSTGEIYFTKEQVGTVSVDELNNITDFAVYPNPVINDQVTVQFINPGSSVIAKITDLNGRLVYSERFTNAGQQTQRLDVSDLSQGMYVLSIENESSRVSKKLIIK